MALTNAIAKLATCYQFLCHQVILKNLIKLKKLHGKWYEIQIIEFYWKISHFCLYGYHTPDQGLVMVCTVYIVCCYGMYGKCQKLIA